MKGIFYMDFLDEAIVKAKDMFSVAKKKTGEAVAIGKQKYDIASIENRLNKSYVALGKICYESFKNDDSASDEIKALISQIESEINEIELAKEEIVRIKGGRICAECGAAVGENSAFCSHCGAKLIFTE